MTAARPDLPPARHPRRGGARLLVPVLAVLLLVAAVLLVLRGLPGLPWGTDEVDRSTPALLNAVEDLEEYHAASGTFQVVVDLERDVRGLPSILAGERTTFLATGSVDALVDLTGLDASAVTIDDDGTVRFSLPPARLAEPRVDLENSRVLSRDRGVLDRVGGIFSDTPTSEREVTMLAEDKLAAAAADSDLRERAERNTREMLTSLARSLGHERVVVQFDAADGL